MFVHGPAIKTQALALVAAGVNDCEIARRLGVARTTVRDWRRPRYVPAVSEACLRCAGATKPVRFTAGDYAELLGLYLGDGHISQLPRTQRLRISLDAKYPGIVRSTMALLSRCFPTAAIGCTTLDGGSTEVVHVYSGHLECLFPQHGPGKKHHRPIRLEWWQWGAVLARPWRFLRGCIHSDGCAFINRTGRYEYLSYEFANHSQDILDIVETVFASVGIAPRRYATRMRIYTRESVALIESNVGLKS
jgi:hypothetical protein